MSENETPKVFISYAWASGDWALELAQRLFGNGVQVVFDKWDLKDGQDLNTFMEQMVTADDIDRVLIVSDQEYAEKANERQGGVGTETQIISGEVYRNVRQEKFVAIVAEVDQNDNAYLPVYMKSRKYIDMSTNEVYEKGYEELLRNLFNRPSLRRPQLGKPPAYLFDDAPNLVGTRSVLKQLNDAYARFGKSSRSSFFKRAFLDSLSVELGQFIITKQEFTATNAQDDIIVDRFKNMQPLRDHIVEYVETICAQEETIDIDIILHLMQTLHRFEYHVDDPNNWNDAQTDQYKLLTMEVFIYVVAALISHERYMELSNLLSATYWLERTRETEEAKQFIAFSPYIRSINEYRKKRLESNKVSLVGKILLERATLPRYPKRSIIQADAALFLLSPIYVSEYTWRPSTWPYSAGHSLPLFQRMKSLRHAEKVKILFKADTVENLRTVVSKLEPQFRLGMFDTLHIRNSINAEDIATLA